MIHYHGSPITPTSAAMSVLAKRHGVVSFANPQQAALIPEICQSFIADNGAFTFWQRGEGGVDVKAFADFVREWIQHPGFDWCLIPDAIDGTMEQNRRLRAEWLQMGFAPFSSVPVWHLHEPIDELLYLCHAYPRVALGSSGEYSDPGAANWWQRMGEAMDAICDGNGRPPCKLHGLRMLDPTIFSQLPLASADSANIARNIGMDSKWQRGSYPALSPEVRALVLADRIESHASAARWTRTYGHQHNFDLVG